MRTAARTLLLLLVFVIPWEYSLELGAPFGNIARVVGLVTLLVALLAVLRAGRIRRLGMLQWLTVALYVWFCCSFLWTLTPNETAAKLRGYPQEMMLVWLIWEFVESPDELRNLMRAWLGGSWVLAVLTLAAFQEAARGGDQIRFTAIGQDPNDTARFLVLGLPIAGFVVDDGLLWIDRVLGWCYFPVAFAAVIVTGSRSGILIAIVAVLGSCMMLFREHPKRILGATLVVPVIGGLIVWIVPSGTLERVGTVTAQLQNGDLNQRFNIWLAGWRAFAGAPMFGHGAGSFAIAAGLYPEDTAHNTALGIMVEGGLCGLILITAIVALSVRSVFKTRRTLRFGLGTLLAVWLIASMVNTVGENRITWLIFGTVAVAERLADQNRKLSHAESAVYGATAEEAG